MNKAPRLQSGARRDMLAFVTDDELRDVLGQIGRSTAQLVEAQARTETTLGRLAVGQQQLVEAQGRTESAVERLAERVDKMAQQLIRAFTGVADWRGTAEERIERLEHAVFGDGKK